MARVMQSFKVMTFNIRKGLGASGVKSHIRQLRSAIAEIGADVVFLQEVMGHSEKRTHKASGDMGNHLETLADTIWPHQAYGKNSVYSTGNHGNAILSKFPLSGWSNFDISTNPLERRGLLHASIQVSPRREINLICLHLDLLGRGRKTQLKKLVERVQETISQAEPLIVAGDFNDWRGQATRVLSEKLQLHEANFSQNQQHLRTFPSWFPMLPLDRIYFRHMKLKNVAVVEDQAWTAISDHRAVVADFILSRK